MKNYETEYPTKWFTINMYQVTIDNTEDDTKIPTFQRRLIPTQRCADLVTNRILNRTRFQSKNEVFEKNSRCFVFSAADEIQGAVGERIFKYWEIRVEPCKESETTCNTKGLVPTDSLRSATLKPELV